VRTTGQWLDLVPVCGEDALLFSSSDRILSELGGAVAALSALKGTSWDATDSGSETTTTGLTARCAASAALGIMCM
jgi:hypothetical protein